MKLIPFLILFMSSFLAFSSDTLTKKVDTTIHETKEFDQTIIRQSKVYWDSHLRIRHESWNNQEDLNGDLDDLYTFYRVKTYLGGGYRFTKNLKFYTRVINESRFYSHKGNGDTILEGDHYFRPEEHYFELVFGQLYLDWSNIGGKPLTIRIGRQNLHNKGFGDQWLIGDGTPIDGSKTFYFNAIRTNYKFSKSSSLDFVLLKNFENDPLVIYSEIEKSVTNITDEYGGWLWYKNHGKKSFNYDFYYIYKNEKGGSINHRSLASSIHTVGAQIKPESEHLWLNAQSAIQAGTYGSNGRLGYGSIIYGGYKLKIKNSEFKVGPWYMYHSGDDPNTKRVESFNNLYGGYPNDDELYINTWANESGTSMWTNINLIGAYVQLKSTSKYNIRFWYHYMMANENVAGDFFGKGKFRGHMIMFKAMGEFGKKLKAYYMFEYLKPGDFYFNNSDDAILSRINLEWYF